MTSKNQPFVYENDNVFDMTLVDLYQNEDEQSSIIYKMGFLKKMKIKLFGTAFLGYYQKKGWKKPFPMYAFQCIKHGIQIGYQTGWKKSLICQKCIHEKYL